MFSQSVIEKIGYYVYFLRDPINKEVIYVGKGYENRVFDHIACSIKSPLESEKLDKIREISKSNKVEHFILRHGLSEKEALLLEAALIDFVGMSNLTNVQGGHYSNDFGLKTTDEIIAIYTAPPFATDLPVILININKLFKREMSQNEIYEATRQAWVMGPRKEKAKYAVATYRGLTREVYEIENWFEVSGRWGFNGKLAPDPIQKELRYKSISSLTKQGAANPIRYINC